jgi:hypothetical protein
MIVSQQTKQQPKQQITKCNHCEGTLRGKDGTIRCLMCGREADHFCEYCIKASYAVDNTLKKTA